MILAPIRQVGWRSACSGVTRAELVGGRVEERPARRGQDQARRPPPSARRPGTARSRSARSRSAAASASGLAQRVRRRASPRTAARARASGMTRWPPATSVSLLAVATTLPARSAASTGRRLTTPPVPTTTRSTSSRVASSTSASSPPTRRAGGRSGRPRGVGQPTIAGRSGRPARRAARRRGPRPARRPGTGPGAPRGRRAPGGRSSRSSPGRRRRPRPAAASADEGDDIQRHDRRREQERVDRGRGSRRGPGSACPESLAPAARLSIDSARSPACAARPSSGPSSERAERRLAERRRA